MALSGIFLARLWMTYDADQGQRAVPDPRRDRSRQHVGAFPGTDEQLDCSRLGFVAQRIVTRECRTLNRWRLGFTLIEMMVVIVLLALLVSMATFQLRGPLQDATYTGNIERLQFLDQQVRAHAQRFGQQSELIIDLDTGGLASSGTSDASTENALRFTPRGGTKIEGVLLADGSIHSGTAKIRISDRGQSATYALQLRSPAGQQEWLLFVGLTGQSLRLKDENEIDQLSRLLSASGDDAD